MRTHCACTLAATLHICRSEWTHATRQTGSIDGSDMTTTQDSDDKCKALPLAAARTPQRDGVRHMRCQGDSAAALETGPASRSARWYSCTGTSWLVLTCWMVSGAFAIVVAAMTEVVNLGGQDPIRILSETFSGEGRQTCHQGTKHRLQR